MRRPDPVDFPLQTPASWDETRLVWVRGARPRRIRPGWFSALVVAAGVGLLLYVAAVRLEGTWAQRFAAEELRRAAPTPPPAATVAPAEPLAPVVLPLGQPVGRLVIPRLGVDVVALEGVDRDILRRGAGHFPGTALPGQAGNASFAGHRDSFFRGLRDVVSGDEVQLLSPAGTYRYRVTGTEVVGPLEVDVIEPGEGRELTLITCHPFDWIGPAPRRFVVRAALLDGGKAVS